MRAALRAIEARLEPLDERIRAGDLEVGAPQGGWSVDGVTLRCAASYTHNHDSLPWPTHITQAATLLDKGEAELSDLDACIHARRGQGRCGPDV